MINFLEVNKIKCLNNNRNK